MKKLKFPTVSLPKVKFPALTFASFKLPWRQLTFSFPFRMTGLILGAITTFILVVLGSLGLLVSYINPVPHITPYIPLHIANELFDSVVYMQANLAFTIGISAGLIVVGLLLHAANFKAWWRAFKAAPMAVVRTPVRFYRKLTVWRDWLLAKIEYLNAESAKWKTAFNIAKSPYSFLKFCGFSPQMAIGLLAVGSTAATGVAINETILADRSFTNGDSGIYAAPAQNPSPTLEEEMAWRKENKSDNTLRIVLGTTPVREIKIENVSIGTVYSNSTVPSSAYTPASGDAATSTPILIGGTVISGGTSTFLEIGELIIEKSRCSYMTFDNITAHTINVIGVAADGLSINQTPGTSRMRAIGGGHHQAEAMVTSGGTYDRIHIDAPTTAVNGKIDKLTLSSIYSEGGACVFDRMKIGTLTIFLNEVGVGDGFSGTKEFKINQSVTAANWNVTDNVEVSIGVPTETLTNE